MKRIELKRLKIENFKGCKSRVVDFSSKTDIFGANAAGKTTLMDAFTWLLFDKDSTGSAKFDIRPCDSGGNMINNVEIMVEALLEVGGKEITLQKAQKQNWVKQRGTNIVSLKGNVNSYEIDSFPAAEKEFKEKVSEIISEDLFKLLTDPRAFASLPWKKQREMLLKFITEITDIDVIATNEDVYRPIANEILAVGVEKAIDKAKKSMTKLRDIQKELPARIDELSRSMDDIPDLSDLEIQMNALQEQLEEILNQKENASSAYKVVSDLQEEIMNTKFEMSAMVQKANQELDNQRREARRNYDTLEAEAYALFNERKKKEIEVERIRKAIEEKEESRKELWEKYKKAISMTMDESEKVCRFCGQGLPDDQIEKILKDFDKKKSEEVERILSAGRTVKQEIDSSKSRSEQLLKEIETLKEQWNEANAKEGKAYTYMNSFPESVDMTENQEYMALQDKLSSIEMQIGNMDTGEKIKEQLSAKESAIRKEIDAVNKKFALVEASEKTSERIEELNAEQKEVSQMVADQERKLDALEEFSRKKMNMLSESINSKFRIVSFKLFDMQINGGMKDTCEMMVNGVPYSSLNSAAKIQAGLDVIAALANLYEVSVPVWIDNRESVSEIPDIGGQVINLFVSPSDKELRVEAE